MRILSIAPLPPPYTGQSIAVKVFNDDLVKHHEVEVVNLSKASFKPGINSLERIFSILKIIFEIRSRQKGKDVIYFTVSESIAGNIKDLLIYLFCYRNLSKMIIHLHGGAGMKEIMNPKGHKVLYMLNKFFVRKLGGIIILGEAHRKIYSEFADPARIRIVPNFAEDYLFVDEEAIKLKFRETGPLKFLFLSNLIPGKGYIELLDGYLALDAKSKEEISIDFAGGFETEEQKSEFLGRIRGHDNLRYHGIVSGNSKKELFSQAHVFCLPTYYPYEGQPISILEAYASGCVVMTTDHSGICDIFTDQVNGFEVQKRSFESIRSTIEDTISNRTRLLSIALNNRKTAFENYRTPFYNETLLNIIESTPQNK